MTSQDSVFDKGVAQLVLYWYRAELMHKHLHRMRRDYDRDMQAIVDDERGWEFETYLRYWLSGLFVVVEGFNKLGIRDSRVQGLFNRHIGYLKEMRHDTYHFTLERNGGISKLIEQLNWAEELHRALKEHFKEFAKRYAA